MIFYLLWDIIRAVGRFTLFLFLIGVWLVCVLSETVVDVARPRRGKHR